MPRMSEYLGALRDAAAAPGNFARYGSARPQPPGIPGLIPNAGSASGAEAWNDRLSSAFNFGRTWPNLAPMVQPAVNALRDSPMGGLNPFSDANQGLPPGLSNAANYGVKHGVRNFQSGFNRGRGRQGKPHGAYGWATGPSFISYSPGGGSVTTTESYQAPPGSEWETK